MKEIAENSNGKTWQFKKESKIDNNPLLIHRVWDVYRPPYGLLDKITLHRVVNNDRLAGGDKHKGKVIFMLPGTWGIGGWSRITDPAINTLLYLANNGYDVYTMDYRSANIPAVDYEQFAELGIDISPTIDWTLGVFREDIHAGVEKIKRESRVEKMFLSGFSRGIGHMVIYASKYRGDLKGLVFLDGVIKDYPPAGIPLDEARYNKMIGLFKTGKLTAPKTGSPILWLNGINSYTANYKSWKLAGVLPYAKVIAGAPLPGGFEVISDFVADDAHHMWDSMGRGEGLFTNYKGGYIDRDVLVKAINEFDPYYPNVQTLEDSQLVAHEKVPYLDYDDNDIDLPAISFHSAFSCPSMSCLVDAIPNRTKSEDVTINFLQGYGHVDILFGKNSLTDVKQPLLEWLNSHLA